MAKKIDLKAAKATNPGDIVAVINAGIQIVDAAAPVLSVLFDKINTWIQSLGSKNPNSPKNVRLRLEALEAKDVLQKQINKLNDDFRAEATARLEALELQK